MLVEWGDAWDEGGWVDPPVELDKSPAIVLSSGFVEDHTDEGITLVGRYSVEDFGPGMRTFIPAGMIRKIKKLRY